MPAPSANTFLKACRSVYGTAVPPVKFANMPTLYLGRRGDDIPPDQSAYPRATIELFNEEPLADSWDITAGLPSIIEADIVIRLYAENSSDDADDLGRAVKLVFTPQNISLTFDPNAVIFRTFYRVMPTGERNQNNQPVYVAEIHYHAMFAPDV